ncbi:GntR family transcriptional regulator [Actinomadura vinacea]|uniref:GntR family transcriptional regulator n=1 Tax=Actinomadura vinacea TaxID=115336 RepID=A0ABN3IUY8_9ACTN
MPPTPLHLAVADDLRQRIITGDLEPGARLPSRAALAEQHHVSEQVVRRAVDMLVAEGLLFTQVGARPVVKARPSVTRLARGWYQDRPGESPFRATMAAQGRTGDWIVRSERTTASERVAERLGIAADAPVMRSDYTFMADGRPVMLSTSWEPLAITAGTPIMLPEQGPYAGKGVVERMAAIEQRITHVEEVNTARPVTAAEGERLQVTAGTLVMVIERTYATDAGARVETADIILPVDRYEVAYVIPVK